MARSEYMKEYHSRPEVKARQKELRLLNIGNVRRNKREWARNHKEGRYNAWLKFKYGITLVDYYSMLHRQGGRCAICNRPPAEGKRLAVDHNHETGKVRGLLCGPCNTALAKFHDDQELLRKAADYVGA